MNIKNWSQAGCTITLDPKTAETLIEWRCPAGYAAEIHEYKVGIDDDYVSLPHPALEIRLVFETLVGRDVIHINPGSEKLQKFSKKVTLIAHNKTDKPLIVWGSLRGTTIAVVSEGTAKVIEETTTIEETAMIDDALENSHVGMKKLAPTALGVVASQDSPPSYEEGDAAALLTDKNGRLLVSIDALTPEAEEQFNRVSEADVTLQERLMEAQSEVERQQTENQLRILREQNKHARKQAKINTKLTSINNKHDEVIAKNEGYVSTAVSASRYDFFGSLTRWTIAAATILSVVYLYFLS